MESEQTKLDRVLKILGFLYQHFDGVTDAKVRQVMLEGLESRFADYDQPVLLIAYMLNPHRRRDFLNPECRFVSWRNAMVLVEVLYNRFFPDAKDGSAVVEQFLQYMNQEAPFDEGMEQFAFAGCTCCTWHTMCCAWYRYITYTLLIVVQYHLSCSSALRCLYCCNSCKHIA